MIDSTKALEIILKKVTLTDTEKISILNSNNRVLAEDIYASIDIPSFNNSAMDGYAVKYKNTKGASLNKPIELLIVEEVRAGDKTNKIVDHRKAITIMTGAPIPVGSDAVIPFEDTKEKDNTVFIYKELKKNENIRFAGEDVKNGQKVIKKGRMISSADIGLLASLNYSALTVFKQPEIAILSTGDEIIDIGEEIKPGSVRNSNAYTLQSLVKESNAIPHYLGIARDNKDDIRKNILKALEYDIVITTGGVSMGRYDFIKEIVEEIGISIHIEKIRIKPGKPVVFGTKGKKLFFGLPGNPVSTMISFIEFVKPALLHMMGADKIKKPVVWATLSGEIKKKADRKHFIRGIMNVNEGNMHVKVTGSQGSGILRSMSEANCLIIIPEGITKVENGEKVLIQLLSHGEI